MEVDDIFKSFVKNKLKEFGMLGQSSVDLEKSLKQSALGQLHLTGKKDVDHECASNKRKKSEKKSKKSKKEKKAKQAKEEAQKVINSFSFPEIKEDNFVSIAKNCEKSSNHEIINELNKIVNNETPKPCSTIQESGESEKASVFSNDSEKEVKKSSYDVQPILCSNATYNNPSADNDTSDNTAERKISAKHHKHSRSHKSRSCSRSPSHKRSKHSRNRHRSRSPKSHKHRHHHKSRSNSDRKRKSSRYIRSPSPVISSQDKIKLLEIAKANVLAQHKAGITASNLSNENKAVLRAGGVTLQQLTGVCKDISEGKREVLSAGCDSEAKPTKVVHPFQVKESQMIAINIKNALPPISMKPIGELTKEFPVSCGSQHQRREILEDVYGKWEPIVKDKKQLSTADAEESSSNDTAVVPTNVKELIAQRVTAVRELQSNPNNSTALMKIMDSQQKLNDWTTSKVIPGQFTGRTSLQPLTKTELERGHQAWASKGSLSSEKQVGGIGKSLLQKMGWKEGESLGKANVGMVEPLQLQVKTDRKGLSSMMEVGCSKQYFNKRIATCETSKNLSGKHPVSAIMEVCSKRRWKAPDFMLIRNDGPDHFRTFMFKVMVNGTFYQPSAPSANKKLAKAQAATAALQALGLLS